MKTFFVVMLSAFALLWSISSGAAPDSELWEFWTKHDPKSSRSVDHSGWQKFLDTYVVASSDGINRVAYQKASQAGQALLEGYITDLTELKPRALNRNEQQSYWINLYNALTVNVILDHYPVESILEIKTSPGFFSPGPWGQKLVTIEGQKISLDDIEHKILRPIWQDNRVHYAVNCASIGCPNLNKVAYTAANTDKLLNENAIDYINHPRGARVNNGTLVVSSIFEWYKIDFGNNDRGVITHLKKHAAPKLKSALSTVSTIDDDAYDWVLNEVQ
jgi:hypothetical protein